jgi:hypothetical protein
MPALVLTDWTSARNEILTDSLQFVAATANEFGNRIRHDDFVPRFHRSTPVGKARLHFVSAKILIELLRREEHHPVPESKAAKNALRQQGSYRTNGNVLAFGKLPDVAKCIGREHVAAIADKLSKIGVAPCGFTFHATCFNA